MGKLPAWYKGKQRICVVCGWWFPENDSRIYKKDDKWICKWDDDTLTDEERREQLKTH